MATMHSLTRTTAPPLLPDLETLSLDQVREIILGDHAEILRLIDAVPKCSELAEDETACFYPDCGHGSTCATAVRGSIRRLMHALIKHFEHEHVAMKRFSSRQDFHSHSDQHGYLSGLLNEAVVELTHARNAIKSIVLIRRFADALVLHTETADSDMLRQFSGAASVVDRGGGPGETAWPG